MSRWHHPPATSDEGHEREPSNRVDFTLIPPTMEAARDRLRAVNPRAYAQSRNHLQGAVTGLSPYITHGLLSLREVLAQVSERHALDVPHRFVQELGWRAFFHHRWRHLGEGIFESLHPGPLPDEAYADELPPDIRQGCTGVPVIDQAVKTLYATGWLHNHARMWLASYVVHLRKVHWRVGADWLYAHLLDGDLASNHLSWQWVAGTGSHKPYLFNAENVARFAPLEWHSPGTVIDTSYAALDRLAQEASALGPEPGAHRLPGQAEPLLSTEPPAWLDCVSPSAHEVAGREVLLLHPWSLGALPADLPASTLVLGCFFEEFHQRWPWSAKRWAFVGERMRQQAQSLWWGPRHELLQALKSARAVRGWRNPHLLAEGAAAEWPAGMSNAPELFPAVDAACPSFSAWWKRATRGVHTVPQLLNPQGDHGA